MQSKSLPLQLLKLLLILLPTVLTAAEPTKIRFSMSFAPGEDVGQKLGSLFEVHDAQGRVVAGRQFRPEEYLAGELSGAGVLERNVPVHVELAIADPGTEAVNYYLTFR